MSVIESLSDDIAGAVDCRDGFDMVGIDVAGGPVVLVLLLLSAPQDSGAVHDVEELVLAALESLADPLADEGSAMLTERLAVVLVEPVSLLVPALALLVLLALVVSQELCGGLGGCMKGSVRGARLRGVRQFTSSQRIERRARFWSMFTSRTLNARSVERGFALAMEGGKSAQRVHSLALKTVYDLDTGQRCLLDATKM